MSKSKVEPSNGWPDTDAERSQAAQPTKEELFQALSALCQAYRDVTGLAGAHDSALRHAEELIASNQQPAEEESITDAQIKRCLNEHFLSSGAATSGEMVMRFARAVLALKADKTGVLK
jgi:hypothetical protein